MRITTTAALAALCLSLTAAGSVSAGCTQGDCKNGIGTWVWDNDHAYTGSFKNGKRTGTGTYVFPNGETYTGGFLDGKFHGHGKYTYADGNVYEGRWQHGKMAGKGVLQRSDGTKQEGYYRDGAIVEQWHDNTEELHETDGDKYPPGYLKKLTEEIPAHHKGGQPAKR